MRRVALIAFWFLYTVGGVPDKAGPFASPIRCQHFMEAFLANDPTYQILVTKLRFSDGETK